MAKEAKTMEALETRTIDELGRVILPKEFRETHDWKEGSKVTISQDQDILIIMLSEDSKNTA